MTKEDELERARIYNIWIAMKQRCTNKNNRSWKNYGARGITVCARWLNFERFRSDMGMRPRGYTLERKKNDENYEPNNCHWATRAAQARNTRRNRRLTYKGETLVISDWAKRCALPRQVIEHRLLLGWSIARALSPRGSALAARAPWLTAGHWTRSRKHARCRDCKTTERPHKARGYCDNCLARANRRGIK